MTTKNNNSAMNTIVETFIIEETEKLIYDNEELDKWNKHVEDLGLEGQKQIVKKDKSPIPFMHLKKGMCEMFRILCPREVPVEKYNITPIPNEILELIGLSKKEQYFKGIEIWYDDKSPDPICVGYTSQYYLYHYEGVPKEMESKIYATKQDCLNAILSIVPTFDVTKSFGWETDKEYYLLGRWADVKASFPELKERAKDRYIEEEGARLRKNIKEDQKELDLLEEKIIEKLS